MMSKMMWRQGQGGVSSGWCHYGVAMRALRALLVVVVQLMAASGWLLLAEAQASPIEIFVPGDRGSKAGSLFRVVYRNSSSLEASVSGYGGDEQGANGACLQCCQFVEHDSGLGSGNRTYTAECSISAAASEAALVHIISDLPSSSSIPSRTTCLRIDSFAGNYALISGRSGRVYQSQMDAVLSLSLYLRWMRGVGMSLADVNRPPVEESVQMRNECSGAEENSRCRLTISSQAGPELEISGRNSVSKTAAIVDWKSCFFSGIHSFMSQQFDISLRVASDSVHSAGAGSESSQESRDRHYIRGLHHAVFENGSDMIAPVLRELILVTLFNSSPNLSVQSRSPRQVKESPGHVNSIIFGVQTSPVGVGDLGRRSLQAKFGAGVASRIQCGDGRLQFRCRRWTTIFVGAIVTLAGVSILAILCAHGTKEAATPTDFLESVPSLPPRFSYTKLQKATKNFSRKLGDGAFGSVYEGSLPNGSRVAVKMLEKTSVQGEKQFRAEVASMGAIRHLNLVRLHGFCSEGSHRLLVYEFMPNGSLDSWLFGKKQGEKLLDWEQRLNIALGTARALAYLHEECSDHIIHLDVKPENILLDHQFCPKLSDFGLAKLMDREQSRVVTSMRGTPGYLAPEWLLPHAAVTAKTDVYSFGMVLLELISGRENTNFSLGKEQWYFPAWAFKLMGDGRTMELLDKRLHVEEVEYFHKKDAVRAIHVALLCIQDDPAVRPPMSRVVHMLQGHVEPEPLNARQAAIQPPRRLLTAFAASMSDIDVNDTRNEQRNDMHHQNVGPAVSTRLAIAESPKVMESPRIPVRVPPQTLEELEEEKGGHVGGERMDPLPPAIQIPNQARGNNKPQRMAGAHSLNSNQKCIPPWPVKGDVILIRGPQGDLHGVVRDVRVQTKQMRLALLHRLSSETRWSVREEEQIWRHWNESVKTLDFWVVVRWSTIPGRGFEKFPVEWMVR